MIEALPNDDVLSLSSLRLLVSPLQLMAGALWGVVQHRAVVHYGLLEDFITAVLDLIPGLLTHSERDQLVLGLRATVVLEMCRSDDLCLRQNIEPHLTRIDDLFKEQNEEGAFDLKMKESVETFIKEVNRLLDDPYKRDMFYQEIIPSMFSLDFDSALCTLVKTFLINLEKLLPVPSLDQTSLWLGLSPPVLKECGDLLNQSELLKELVQHHKQDSYFSSGPFVNNFIFSSLFGQQGSDEVMSKSSCKKEDKLLEAEVMPEDVPSVEVTLDESDTEPQDSNGSVANADQTHVASQKTYRCFVCGQTFCSLFKLQKHIIPRCSADTFGKSMTQGNAGSRGRRHNQPSSMDFVISSDTSEEQMCKSSSRLKSCSICGETFASSKAFTNHLRAHADDASYICGQCSKPFHSYEAFMFHQRNGCRTSRDRSMESSYKLLGIKECSVVLRRVSHDTPISPQICTVTCKDCGQRVLKNGFKVHRRNCSKRKRPKKIKKTLNEDWIRVKPCTFNSLSKLSQINIETESEQSTSYRPSFYCTLCDESFTKILVMKRHYHYFHKLKGPYRCPVCTRSFVRLCELVKHHNDQLLFQCNTCEWCFPSRKQMRRHKRQFNDTCASTYICDVCGKKCASPAILKWHKQCHDRPKETTVCSYCGKKFSSKYCLNVHMNRHTGGFPCSICPKVFFQKIYLKRHMHIHNGTLQPFLCEICGKDWPTKGNLKVHMIEHSQDRPFKCDQCDQAYKKRSSLKVHVLNKHSQHKPYVCSVCGAEYKSSSMLREHMIKHTGVRPHGCSKCGKRFVRLYHLKVHHKTCLYKWTKTKL